MDKIDIKNEDKIDKINEDKINDELFEELKKSFQEIINYGKGKCCVCRHDLDLHFDEKDVWRCHSLAADGWQCECALRKNRAEDIFYYDLSDRAKKQLNDLEKNKF